MRGARSVFLVTNHASKQGRDEGSALLDRLQARAQAWLREVLACGGQGHVDLLKCLKGCLCTFMLTWHIGWQLHIAKLTPTPCQEEEGHVPKKVFYT